jgi:hypothetical protein
VNITGACHGSHSLHLGSATFGFDSAGGIALVREMSARNEFSAILLE